MDDIWVQFAGRKRRGHYERLWYYTDPKVSAIISMGSSSANRIRQTGRTTPSGHKVIIYRGQGNRTWLEYVAPLNRVKKVRSYTRRA